MRVVNSILNFDRKLFAKKLRYMSLVSFIFLGFSNEWNSEISLSLFPLLSYLFIFFVALH